MPFATIGGVEVDVLQYNHKPRLTSSDVMEMIDGSLRRERNATVRYDRTMRIGILTQAGVDALQPILLSAARVPVQGDITGGAVVQCLITPTNYDYLHHGADYRLIVDLTVQDAA